MSPGSRNDRLVNSDDRIQPTLVLSIVAMGIMAFIGILTETLTNVLFPELMAEFHVDTSTIQWLTTGYPLMVSLVTPLSSYLKRKYPLKNIFLTAILLCIAGCLIAACTLNFPMLMVARLLQGAGTGIALPLMFNIILEQSPRTRMGMFMGIGGMIVAVAPALGPTVGGLVGTFMPWRWIFAIMLPFLLVSLLLGLKNIRQMAPFEDAHINPLHVLLLAAGFVSFVFALDRGGAAITAISAGDQGAAGACAIALVLLCGAVVLLALFVVLSRRAFSPLVRLGVLHSVKFRWHLLAYVLLQFVTIGYGYMIPNASRLGFGASVLAAGTIVLPGALLGAIMGPVAGSLLDKFGPVRPMPVAMAAALLGTVLMAMLIGPGSNVIMIGVCYFVYMVGFSMCFANTMTCGIAPVHPEFKADGNALFNTFQQLSGAVDTTVMSVCRGIAQSGARPSGFRLVRRGYATWCALGLHRAGFGRGRCLPSQFQGLRGQAVTVFFSDYTNVALCITSYLSVAPSRIRSCTTTRQRPSGPPIKAGVNVRRNCGSTGANSAELGI